MLARLLSWPDNSRTSCVVNYLLDSSRGVEVQHCQRGVVRKNSPRKEGAALLGPLESKDFLPIFQCSAMLSSSLEAGPDISPKLERIRDLLLFQRASQAALAEGYFLFIGTVPKTPAPPRAQPPDSSQSKSAAHSVRKTLVSGTRNEFGSRYFSFSYSALACFRMGMSGSAYCQWAKKSR